jgi:hypothetical protein
LERLVYYYPNFVNLTCTWTKFCDQI